MGFFFVRTMEVISILHFKIQVFFSLDNEKRERNDNRYQEKKGDATIMKGLYIIIECLAI